jgi:hypothetical protein
VQRRSPGAQNPELRFDADGRASIQSTVSRKMADKSSAPGAQRVRHSRSKKVLRDSLTSEKDAVPQMDGGNPGLLAVVAP